MHRISVIIPTYNRANLIDRAIRSVLDQTYSNYELIIVDDGSSDTTEKVISNYSDKLIYLKTEHRGVSHARNTGILKSSGDWIAFLDSDDVWLPEKLEYQLLYLKNHPHFKVCHTDEIWIRNGIRINQRKKHKKFEGWFFKESLKMCLISPSTVLIKREVFDEIGYFDENFQYVEDYELWLRVTSRYPVGYIDKKLIIKYGGHSDQLSKKINGIEKYRMQALEKFIRENANLKEMYEFVKLALMEYNKKYIVYIRGCMKRGKFEEIQNHKRTRESLIQLVNNHKPD